VNTQSRYEISVITNPILHNFFRQQFKRFNDECQLPSPYLNWMLCSKCPPAAATHENQVSFEITGLPYQWTPVAKHSVSTARQSSGFSSAMLDGLGHWAWISDSIPALHPTRHNPMDFGMANSVVNRFSMKPGHFYFNSLFTLKNAHLNSSSYKFWM